MKALGTCRMLNFEKVAYFSREMYLFVLFWTHDKS